MTATILKADVLEWLRGYEGPRFQAVFADGPYGLEFMGKAWDKFTDEDDDRESEQTNEWGDSGRDIPAARSNLPRYTGKTDASLLPYQQWVTSWARLLIEKAVYPGAIGAFFGSPRTFHRLACGLEDAGWILMTTCMWVYGSGFPKSLDISKSIDKTERARWFQEHSEELRPHIPSNSRWDWIRGGHSPSDDWWEDIKKLAGGGHLDRAVVTILEKAPGWFTSKETYEVTTANSERAAAWDGWKSPQLKPAWEPILIAMAPRQGMTHAELALKFGTGSLNIDGARIRSSKPNPSILRREWNRGNPDVPGGGGTWDKTGRSGERYSEERPGESLGRFPSNVMLQHADGCVKKGTKKVRGITGGTGNHDGLVYGARTNEGEPVVDYADADGMEEVDDWACEDSCPVRLLDEQAGESSPGHWPNGSVTGYGELGGGARSYGGQGPKEEGGKVSRFFYTAKASSWERSVGLPDGPRNPHPTVKPLSINRYIARLLLPPKLTEPRRVLVPFAGSGSEMIGAMLAGWDEVVGIEREEEYVRIAEARLKWWAANPEALDEKPMDSETEKRAKKEKGKSASLDSFEGGEDPSS